MKTNNKERLLEMVGKLDKSFKPILNEAFDNNNNNNIVTLIYNAIAAGWITDLNKNVVTKTYDSENIYTFKINEKYIKLVEIDQKGIFLYVDGNRVNGDSSVLVQMYNLLKNQNQNLREELSGSFYKPDETPVGGDFDKGEYFDAKLDELLQQMKESGIEYDSIMQNVNKFYPNGQGELQESNLNEDYETNLKQNINNLIYKKTSILSSGEKIIREADVITLVDEITQMLLNILR